MWFGSVGSTATETSLWAPFALVMFTFFPTSETLPGEAPPPPLNAALGAVLNRPGVATLAPAGVLTTNPTVVTARLAIASARSAGCGNFRRATISLLLDADYGQGRRQYSACERRSKGK